jgi:hypothetical protein
MVASRSSSRARAVLGARIVDWAVRVVSLLLLTLGILKLVGVVFPEMEVRPYLGLANPLVPFLPNRSVLTLAAVVEIFVGQHCLRSQPLSERSALLLWFAAGVFFYKGLLAFVRYHSPCGCLVGINRFIPLDPDSQRTIADLITVVAALVAATALAYTRWGDVERGRASSIVSTEGNTSGVNENS